jgi:hypothetical protein
MSVVTSLVHHREFGVLASIVVRALEVFLERPGRRPEG